MKTKVLITSLLSSVLLVATSCKNESEVTGETSIVDVPSMGIELQESSLGYKALGRSEADCHFEYEGDFGPEYWSDLCSGAWTDCAGNSQSPVNIVTQNVSENDDLEELYLGYRKSYVSILNNGHTIQFNYSPGSYSYLNGKKYELLQFHFHTESEHTLNGKQYPMEVHFVHRDVKTSNLAVVGVIFEEGRKNTLLSQFMNSLPEEAGGVYTSDVLYNAKDIFNNCDDDFLEEYYTYGGSLTTPPCSEIVTWYVLKQPIQASAYQIAKIKSIEHENNRPVQPLNGRVIEASED